MLSRVLYTLISTTTAQITCIKQIPSYFKIFCLNCSMMLFSIILHNLIQFVPSIGFHGDTSCSLVKELARGRKKAGKKSLPGVSSDFKLLTGHQAIVWRICPRVESGGRGELHFIVSKHICWPLHFLYSSFETSACSLFW